MESTESPQSMHPIACSPEERLQRRRTRRWKRRARAIGPFVGVTILLAALSLSVDLVEYQPTPKVDRRADRPIYIDPVDGIDQPLRLNRVVLGNVRDTGPIPSDVSVISPRESKLNSDLSTLDLAIRPRLAAETAQPPGTLP